MRKEFAVAAYLVVWKLRRPKRWQLEERPARNVTKCQKVPRQTLLHHPAKYQRRREFDRLAGDLLFIFAP